MAGSSEYWKKREKEAKAATLKDEAEYKARIEKIYNQTIESIERQVNDWYARYANDNNMTMAEARAKVRKLDMERYERLAAKYVATRDFSDEANEEMKIYNLTMRINRLELLKAQINLELLAGYDDIQNEMERDLIETAMKEDRRLAGILGDSVIGNQRYARVLVNASFQNATFSERLWGNNMPKLRARLETELRNGLIQGIHPRELARRFRSTFGGSIRDTERLMVTEMRRLQTDVQKESFERNGFAEYRFITTGDERVCPECEKLNGQHFKVSEMQPGENAPPMHPSCRCSTAAYMDSDKYKRWIDALERGEDVRWQDFENDIDNGGIAASASKMRPKFDFYKPDAKTRQEIIKRGIEEERAIFADDLLGKLAYELPPKEGWYDVVLHGWPNHLEFFGQDIDVETLCAIIAQRKDYKKGTPIRLISCYTGSIKDGVAQYVSNKLNVDVEAPDKKGIINKNIYGEYSVYSGSKIGKHDGEMVPFHPQRTKVIRNEEGTSRVYY